MWHIIGYYDNYSTYSRRQTRKIRLVCTSRLMEFN